ncbi:hypothetical protein D8674_010446 [Pyrus ussuriensis x Pyrus communis]|uniref:Uncharacterized protein n=1 Tax=Pyrus ussuriensis x Pyrus communis TaxID=2448454 RepID=A0A5N5FAS6_9ROSA|nr:hypothetical protein D8674_010446 [Pyrus ussuriensis x Pyrus communis]
MPANCWLRPKVYPLFTATRVTVRICGLSLYRHITINPEQGPFHPPPDHHHHISRSLPHTT